MFDFPSPLSLAQQRIYIIHSTKFVVKNLSVLNCLQSGSLCCALGKQFFLLKIFFLEFQIFRDDEANFSLIGDRLNKEDYFLRKVGKDFGSISKFHFHIETRIIPMNSDKFFSRCVLSGRLNRPRPAYVFLPLFVYDCFSKYIFFPSQSPSTHLPHPHFYLHCPPFFVPFSLFPLPSFFILLFLLLLL